MCEETTQGSFQPNRYNDILSAALGNEESSGAVRGVGAYARINVVFGKPKRSRKKSSENIEEIVEKARKETLSSIQPAIDSLNQQIAYLMKNLSATLLFPQAHVDFKSLVSASPQSVHMPASSCHSVDPYRVNTIQSPTHCQLALCNDDVPFVVAMGMVHPIDEVVSGAEGFNLPVPTQHHFTVGEIVGSVTQWPMHLVILNEENIGKRSPRQTKGVKDQSVECGDLSAVCTQPSLVPDDNLSYLGYDCKQLVSLLTGWPLSKDIIEVDINHEVFYAKNVKKFFVDLNDIKDLLFNKWLNVSIVQVFANIFIHCALNVKSPQSDFCVRVRFQEIWFITILEWLCNISLKPLTNRRNTNSF